MNQFFHFSSVATLSKSQFSACQLLICLIEDRWKILVWSTKCDPSNSNITYKLITEDRLFRILMVLALSHSLSSESPISQKSGKFLSQTLISAMYLGLQTPHMFPMLILLFSSFLFKIYWGLFMCVYFYYGICFSFILRNIAILIFTPSWSGHYLWSRVYSMRTFPW